MNAALGDAESPTGSYSRGKIYKTVEYPEVPRMTKVRVSTSTEVRLGGSYLLHVELSRKEIAQLFYETHGGDIVRMFRSFVEDEKRQDARRTLEWLDQREERQRQQLGDRVTEPREPLPFNPLLLKKVDELSLTLRASLCLKNADIVYVGDLVQKYESEMLRTPNFVRKSLNEVKEVLVQMGLHLGMEVPNWPPKDIESLAKRYEELY